MSPFGRVSVAAAGAAVLSACASTAAARHNEKDSQGDCDAHHGAPSSQRWRSLAGSNFDNVGMLLPTADSAIVSVDSGNGLGTDAITAIGELVDAPQLLRRAGECERR